MQSFYLRVFDFIDNAKPTHLGIYFSLFFHLSILLFAIGLPDFFKPNKIPMPQIIPIEILNISDVTSLAPKKETLETKKNESKKIKQKKFNSTENTEIQKIDLQEKPLFAVEAGVINGWEKYINHKNFIGMSSFGASGPYRDVYKHFGITSDDICEKIQLQLNL